MLDHVGVAVSDLAASERFYRTVLSELGLEPSHADAGLVEWDDWAIGPPDAKHPVVRGLHVGFRAPSRTTENSSEPHDAHRVSLRSSSPTTRSASDPVVNSSLSRSMPANGLNADPVAARQREQ